MFIFMFMLLLQPEQCRAFDKSLQQHQCRPKVFSCQHEISFNLPLLRSNTSPSVSRPSLSTVFLWISDLFHFPWCLFSCISQEWSLFSHPHMLSIRSGVDTSHWDEISHTLPKCVGNVNGSFSPIEFYICVKHRVHLFILCRSSVFDITSWTVMNQEMMSLDDKSVACLFITLIWQDGNWLNTCNLVWMRRLLNRTINVTGE